MVVESYIAKETHLPHIYTHIQASIPTHIQASTRQTHTYMAEINKHINIQNAQNSKNMTFCLSPITICQPEITQA